MVFQVQCREARRGPGRGDPVVKKDHHFSVLIEATNI